MEKNNDRLKTMIQGGAVGISILLILLIWQIVSQGLDVIRENTQIMTRLVELIENPRTSAMLASLLPSYLIR